MPVPGVIATGVVSVFFLQENKIDNEANSIAIDLIVFIKGVFVKNVDLIRNIEMRQPQKTITTMTIVDMVAKFR